MKTMRNAYKGGTQSRLQRSNLIDVCNVSSDPDDPTIDITQPDVDTTQADVDATQPDVDAKQHDIDATQPDVDATQPDDDATQPEVDVTQPDVDTTQPKDDGKNWVSERPASRLDCLSFGRTKIPAVISEKKRKLYEAKFKEDDRSFKKKTIYSDEVLSRMFAAVNVLKTRLRPESAPPLLHSTYSRVNPTTSTSEIGRAHV